ncbi:MAG: hypothetical protein RIC15_11940 [Vicingaceae bacterium]
MKNRTIQRTALFLGILFISALLLEACAASRPGFNSGGKKGAKVKSSGKMYK